MNAADDLEHARALGCVQRNEFGAGGRKGARHLLGVPHGPLEDLLDGEPGRHRTARPGRSEWDDDDGAEVDYDFERTRRYFDSFAASTSS